MPFFATWVAVNEVFLALTITNDMILKDRNVIKLLKDKKIDKRDGFSS